MSDQVTVTSHESYFSRLGGSFKGILTGLVFFVLSFPLLFWNESNYVKSLRTLKEGRNSYVTASYDQLDPSLDGKLVYVAGRAVTGDVLDDPVFDIHTNAMQLVRKVEYYLWTETSTTKTKTNVGGSQDTETTYTYAKEWVDSPVDSSRFEKPEGHENPVSFPVDGRSVVADSATFGAYSFPRDRIDGIGRLQPLELPPPVAAAEAPAAPAKAEPATAVQDEAMATALKKKMSSIVIPETSYRDASIEDVIKDLCESSRDYDDKNLPENQRGVNIVLKRGSATTPATGADIPDILPITINAHGLTLLQALDTVMMLGSLKYRIRDNTVFVIPLNEPDDIIVSGADKVAPTADPNVPKTAPAGTKRDGTRGYYIGADPLKPAVGDMRVAFEFVPAQADVSVVARQSGNSFSQYQTKNKPLFLQRNGIVDPETMFDDAVKGSKLTVFILRIIGFLVMFAGLKAILNPLRVLADVIPLVGRIVNAGISAIAGLIAFALSLVTIAIAWLYYRPLIGVPLLVVAVGAIVVAKTKVFAAKPTPNGAA